MTIDPRKQELLDMLEKLCVEADMDEDSQFQMVMAILALEELAIGRGRLIERGELPDETAMPLSHRIGMTLH
jgi:hypothetical protein